MLASLVASALASPVVGAGVFAAPDELAAEDVTLRAATGAREAAEQRAASLRDELAELSATVEERFAGAAELSADIESARRDLRRSAVSAYMSGGPVDDSLQLLAGSDLAEISGRRTFATTRTLDFADALAAFEALKRDNDPELVELVERREALSSRVADAEDALFQARATESDAERIAAQAAADRAAAAEAERRVAAERSAAAARATPTTSRSRAVQPSPAPGAPTTSAPVATSPTTVAPRREIVPLTEPSAPLPELPPGGPSPEAWAEVRRCESGGNYRAVSRSGRYRGAYQFDQQTWGAMGGVGDPAAALPIEQDARARLLFMRRGARAWPHCGLALL